MGKGSGRRIENAKLIDANWARALYSWRCTARRSHGLCNTVNDDADETCGACGAAREEGQAL